MADIVQDYTKNGMPPICLDAPIHTQHKESMLCQTKGVSICPIHLDVPCLLGWPHVWMAPVCLGAPIEIYVLGLCTVST